MDTPNIADAIPKDTDVSINTRERALLKAAYDILSKFYYARYMKNVSGECGEQTIIATDTTLNAIKKLLTEIDKLP